MTFNSTVLVSTQDVLQSWLLMPSLVNKLYPISFTGAWNNITVIVCPQGVIVTFQKVGKQKQLKKDTSSLNEQPLLLKSSWEWGSSYTKAMQYAQ